MTPTASLSLALLTALAFSKTSTSSPGSCMSSSLASRECSLPVSSPTPALLGPPTLTRPRQSSSSTILGHIQGSGTSSSMLLSRCLTRTRTNRYYRRVLPKSALSRVFFPSENELLEYFSPSAIPCGAFRVSHRRITSLPLPQQITAAVCPLYHSSRILWRSTR